MFSQPLLLFLCPTHPSGLQGGAFTWIFTKPPPLHVRDMPDALQPDRPCQKTIRLFEETIAACADPVMRVNEASIVDMEDILRLLTQLEPLPCDWAGGVICGHVLGVKREDGIEVEVDVVEPEDQDEFQIDDFVTAASPNGEKESFYLARILNLYHARHRGLIQVQWYQDKNQKEFGSYKAQSGGDEGRNTDWIHPDSCRRCTVIMDGRSRRNDVYRIQLDAYGKEENAIRIAMAAGRLAEEEHDSQENQLMF